MSNSTPESLIDSPTAKAGNTTRICTWNIGGGLIDSGGGYFNQLNLNYFCNILLKANADVVFIQESHSYNDNRRSQAKIISEYIGHDYFVDQVISNSHLERDASLSLALSARSCLFDVEYVELPNPDLSSVGPDGKPWISFDKGVLMAKTLIRGQSVSLANAHLFPLHHFNRDPGDTEFSHINERFMDSISMHCSSSPFIMGADLNMDDPFETLPSLADLKLSSSLPVTPTTPTGLVNDYIIVNEMFETKGSGVHPTRADHYLCWSDLQFRDIR